MNTSKDARAFSAVKLGDGTPLVPDDAQALGPGAMVAAALKRLAALKREPAPIIYRRAPTPPERDLP